MAAPDDQVSPNVIIGFGILVCFCSVFLIADGYAWWGFLLGVLGALFGTRAWFDGYVWPKMSRAIRRKWSSAALLVQIVGYVSVGVAGVALGHRDRGPGIAWLATAVLLASFAVAQEFTDRRKAKGTQRRARSA